MPGINRLYKAAKRELQVEVGSTYYTIPGVLSDDITAGQAESETVETYDGVTTETGAVQPGQVTIEALYNPLIPLMQELDKLYRSGDKANFQFLTKGQGVLFTAAADPDTVAWTTAGVTTFGGAKPEFNTDLFKVGDIINTNESSPTKVVISAISADGSAVTVAALQGQTLKVQAAIKGYSIERPDIKQGPFAASVAQFGDVSTAAGGNQQTTIVLQPNSVLPIPNVA